jgi:hypothetical protein
VTPMAFVGAVRVDRRAVRWLVVAFVTGSALSGWVAAADHLGGDFGRLLTHIPNTAGRQIGFSNQPNFLAAGLVLAIPFAWWLVFSPAGRSRLLGLVSLPGLALGVFASGSRGGAVCTVLALGLCVVLHPRTRPYWLNVAGAAVWLVGVVAIALPSVGATVLRVTRLAGGSATSGSDSVRSLVFDQGVRDFVHSPLIGIGLQASTDASQVYLQELASGGLLLCVGVNLYMLGGLWAAGRLAGREGSTLAGAVVAALASTLVLNIFEADLTDRFYYVPAALLIALAEARRRVSRPDETVPEGVLV